MLSTCCDAGGRRTSVAEEVREEGSVEAKGSDEHSSRSSRRTWMARCARESLSLADNSRERHSHARHSRIPDGNTCPADPGWRGRQAGVRRGRQRVTRLCGSSSCGSEGRQDSAKTELILSPTLFPRSLSLPLSLCSLSRRPSSLAIPLRSPIVLDCLAAAAAVASGAFARCC